MRADFTDLRPPILLLLCKILASAWRLQDVQALFSADDGSAVLSEKILALQNAAGIKTKLVNPRAAGIKTVTLSGWSALFGLLATIAVIIGGAYFGYQKWLAQDPAYVMVSKSGDV